MHLYSYYKKLYFTSYNSLTLKPWISFDTLTEHIWLENDSHKKLSVTRILLTL